jgi:acylpyruvate hydrolase
MKFATVRSNGGHRAARVEGDEVVLLPFADVGELLASGGDWMARAADHQGEVVPAEGLSIAPLVPRPEKIFCVGLNYASHAAEANLGVLKHPTLFAKYARALIGPHDELVLPRRSDAVDWEIELAVVIGKTVRQVAEAEAEDAVAGYAIVNDVSMRDWQLRTSQYLSGKTFEASTPFGPYLVTPDEADHGRSLGMTLTVDGQVMQQATTDDLIFSVPELVSYASEIITLVPGDVILTGTPAGVGHVRIPPTYLRPGNIIEANVEKLGTQVTRCVASKEA